MRTYTRAALVALLALLELVDAQFGIRPTVTVTVTSTSLTTTKVLPKTPQYFTTTTLTTTLTTTDTLTETAGSTTLTETSSLPPLDTTTAYPPANFTPILSALSPLGSSIAVTVNSTAAAKREAFPPPYTSTTRFHHPKPSTTTTTVTVSSTVTSLYPTATIVVSETLTTTSTILTTTTVASYTATTTTTTQLPEATYYAACGPDNIVNSYNGSSIGYPAYTALGGQFYTYENVTSQYDCCVLCITNPAGGCIGSNLRLGSNECFTYAGVSDCASSDNVIPFGETPSCEVLQYVSSGYCTHDVYHDAGYDGLNAQNCEVPAS